MELTQNEREVVKLITSKPLISLREIARKRGKTLNTATYLVNSLEKKGVLERQGQATAKVYKIKDGYQISSEVWYFDQDLRRTVDPKFVINGTS